MDNVVISKTAGAAVTKGKFVKLSGANVIHCTASTDAVFGIALETVESGGLVPVCVAGECDALFAAAQTVGAKIITNSSGLVAADAGTSTHVVAGIALETGATSGYHKVCLAVIKPANA